MPNPCTAYRYHYHIHTVILATSCYPTPNATFTDSLCHRLYMWPNSELEWKSISLHKNQRSRLLGDHTLGCIWMTMHNWLYVNDCLPLTPINSFKRVRALTGRPSDIFSKLKGPKKLELLIADKDVNRSQQSSDIAPFTR